LNKALPEGRLSVNDLMIKATALALEQVPALNASYAEDSVRRYGAVHMGFAVAIDEGLVTPVVRDCHLKSIGRIAREARELVERAKARTLKPDDLQGGTFTLSNLGMFDVVHFTAIINPVSCDHRALDGATAARFLKALKDVLEAPEKVVTS
jgi:pyruvate dehydrogenase E2 component (dihydrolipoamide acetyltransferase)